MYAWHWSTLRVWAKVWRRWLVLTPLKGATIRRALDFAQVNAALDGLAIPRGDWPAIHDRLDIMESAALEALAEQR
ncbi:MAG: DUF1799 domain-containing protein [Rhodocyclaceae bacterium]|nr:DUF1799 domain-containing protein [Rhodocyclaceae bacterium]